MNHCTGGMLCFKPKLENVKSDEIALKRRMEMLFVYNGVFAQCYLPILTNLSHLDRLYWPGWVCRKGQVRTTPHLKPIQDTKYQGYVIGYCDCEGNLLV